MKLLPYISFVCWSIFGGLLGVSGIRADSPICWSLLICVVAISIISYRQGKEDAK